MSDILTETPFPLEILDDLVAAAQMIQSANDRGWLLHGLVQLHPDTKLSPWAAGFKRRDKPTDGYGFSPTGRGNTICQAIKHAFDLLPVEPTLEDLLS